MLRKRFTLIQMGAVCSALPTVAYALPESEVSAKFNERLIRGDSPLPIALQLGTDVGLLNNTPNIVNEGPFSGYMLSGKSLASLLFEDWIAELGIGWSYSALYGKTRSENPAEPSIGHRVFTQSAFAEGGLRFRFTPKLNVGLIVQNYFGTDLTLSQRKDLVSNMLLGGGMVAFDLLGDAGIFRLGASILAELPDNQRTIQFYALNFQFGIPLRGYDLLLRKTDVHIRSEKVQKVEVPKVVTRTVVRDVSKYTLPRDTFQFARGQAFLSPEDQSFVLELAKTLRQHQSQYKTVSIEAVVRASSDPQRDFKISEARAQAIRNALVSAGLSPQRVFASGLGGKGTLDERNQPGTSVTLVDLAFTGLTYAETLTDALNNLFRRRFTPETCQGEKCK